jgi:hypothetical protein
MRNRTPVTFSQTGYGTNELRTLVGDTTGTWQAGDAERGYFLLSHSHYRTELKYDLNE